MTTTQDQQRQPFYSQNNTGISENNKYECQNDQNPLLPYYSELKDIQNDVLTGTNFQIIANTGCAQ